MEKHGEFTPAIGTRGNLRQAIARFARRNELAVEFLALPVEPNAIDIGDIGAGERDVETAGVAAIEWRIAEQHAAVAGSTVEGEFEDDVFVPFVEDEPAAGTGFCGSGNSAAFGMPGSRTKSVPSAQARAVERMGGC